MPRFGAGLSAPLTLLPLGLADQRSDGSGPRFEGIPASRCRSRCVLAASPHFKRSGRSRCPASCRPGAGRRTRCDWPAFAGQSRRARRARCAGRAGGIRVRTEPSSRQFGVYGRRGFGRRPRRHGRRGAASVRHVGSWRARRRAARNDPAGRSRDTSGGAGACSAGEGRVRGAPDPQRALAGASRSRSLRADRLQNWELLAVFGGGNRRGYNQQCSGHALRHAFRRRTGGQAEGPPRFRLEPAFARLRGQCRPHLVQRVPDRGCEELSNADAGPARRDLAHAPLRRDRKIASSGRRELDQHHGYCQRRQFQADRGARNGGYRAHLQPAHPEVHRHRR